MEFTAFWHLTCHPSISTLCSCNFNTTLTEESALSILFQRDRTLTIWIKAFFHMLFTWTCFLDCPFRITKTFIIWTKAVFHICCTNSSMSWLAFFKLGIIFVHFCFIFSGLSFQNYGTSIASTARQRGH